MKIIAGLGNPEPKYENTRHNVGFMVIDTLGRLMKAEPPKKESKFDAEISFTDLNDEKIALVKPLTYMNRSGWAIQKIAHYFKVDAKDCLIICDDLDTPIGQLRIRKKGGPGTHNGLKSVSENIGDSYPRIRVGIENRTPEIARKQDAADYVLSDFTKDEAKELPFILDKAAEAALLYIEQGPDTAMNKYN